MFICYSASVFLFLSFCSCLSVSVFLFLSFCSCLTVSVLVLLFLSFCFCLFSVSVTVSYLLPISPEVDEQVDLEVDVVDQRDWNEEEGEDPHVTVHQVVQQAIVRSLWRILNFGVPHFIFLTKCTFDFSLMFTVNNNCTVSYLRVSTLNT